MRAAAAPALGVLLAGCLGIPGRVVDRLEDGWVTLPRAVSIEEGRTYDCGAEALHSVLAYHGRIEEFDALRDELLLEGVDGTFPQKLTAAARRRGFRARWVAGTFDALRASVDAGRPAIVMIRIRGSINHFAVATGYHPQLGAVACEFYGGRNWILARAELDAAWAPCGYVQLELDPDPDADRIARARRLEADGRLAEALALYRQAAPSNPDARIGAGNCLARDGDLQGARAEYRAALEAGGRDPELLNNLAYVTMELGEAAQALAWAAEAVRGYRADAAVPGSGPVAARKLALSLGTLGAALLATGDRAGARSCFAESLALLPDSESELRSRRVSQIEACGPSE